VTPFTFLLVRMTMVQYTATYSNAFL